MTALKAAPPRCRRQSAPRRSSPSTLLLGLFPGQAGTRRPEVPRPRRELPRPVVVAFLALGFEAVLVDPGRLRDPSDAAAVPAAEVAEVALLPRLHPDVVANAVRAQCVAASAQRQNGA